MRSQAEVDRVSELLRAGCSVSEVARVSGIPRSTVRDWRNGRLPTAWWRQCDVHEPWKLNAETYAYLLGMYLGDGCISVFAHRVRLRIVLDAKYPSIIAECRGAIDRLAPGNPAHLVTRREERAVEVSKYWKHWLCLFPQHGAGPKHGRPIVLVDWQARIVHAHPEPFLRGLIHSDGCRIIATERKGQWARQAPRYVFSNASADIRDLFAAACNATGVQFTRPSPRQIAIYRKRSVDRLDEFVGPKL